MPASFSSERRSAERSFRANLIHPAVTILIAFIAPLCVAAEDVKIFVDKEAVSVDDFVRIEVFGVFERPSEIEILIAGKDALWLCKNESPSRSILEGCGKTSWLVKIPREWESGQYFVKVNVHSGSTLEFSKALKIVKPRITKIEIPEFVYQGKNKVKVFAELAENSKAKIGYRIVGQNVDERYGEFFNFDKDGVSEFYVDLRKFGILKPGTYFLELKLYYNGTLFDIRSTIFEIAEPRISLSFKEEITAGETLRVEISTNRMNDAEYSGIFVILVGKNYKAVKFVELDEKGNARVVFETAGMSEGEYKIYARDTGLTLRGIDPRTFAKNHYDLDPSDSYAKIFQADDDVVVSKNLKIKRSDATRASVSVFFEPGELEIQCNSSAVMNLFLIGSDSVSGYDVRISVEDEDIAEIKGVITPSNTHEDYGYCFGKAARFKVFDFRSDGSMKFKLAEIEIRGVSEGETAIKIESAKINDKRGNELHPVLFDARIAVKCSRSVEEIEGQMQNQEGEFDARGEKLGAEEMEWMQSGGEKNETDERALLKEIPKPKSVQTKEGDIVAMLASAAAFMAAIGRKIMPRKKPDHGP